MSFKITPLDATMLEEAADLAAARYRRQLEQVPCLPATYAEAERLYSLLSRMIASFPGVAAVQAGKLVGFLCAWLLPDFQGRKAAFSPELANGAGLRPEEVGVVETSRRVYEAMYTQLAAAWVADGIPTHLISTLPVDATAIASWSWLGFGMLAADGLRPLTTPPDSNYDRKIPDSLPDNVIIRRAGVQDAETILFLDTALDRYLAEAPTFMPHESGHSLEEVCQRLASPEHAFWIALQGDNPLAFLWMGPASQDACPIIVDEGTTSILAAYTVESARCQGIALALLDEGLVWAQGRGYVRCAVDFEPMNPLARRFWLRYFEPVSLTLGRNIQ